MSKKITEYKEDQLMTLASTRAILVFVGRSLGREIEKLRLAITRGDDLSVRINEWWIKETQEEETSLAQNNIYYMSWLSNETSPEHARYDWLREKCELRPTGDFEALVGLKELSRAVRDALEELCK